MRLLVTGGSGFIGRQLLGTFAGRGTEMLNVDVVQPTSSEAAFANCSILDGNELTAVFRDFAPTGVVHLAAKATMEGDSLEDFKENVLGTQNVLQAVKSCASVARVIITSTQHVRKPGAEYTEREDHYDPYLFYGQSKVLTETLTRSAGLECIWTIIRPTTVWGPGHLAFADGLWRQMVRGRYRHPSDDKVRRSYGYVKNVCWQIAGLLEAPADAVHRKTFYVGDGNFAQKDWVNAMSRALTGGDVKTVPKSALIALAKFGDFVRKAGISFPLYTERLSNLTTTNPVPMDAILRLLGTPPVSLEQGVEETVAWLREYYAANE